MMISARTLAKRGTGRSSQQVHISYPMTDIVERGGETHSDLLCIVCRYHAFFNSFCTEVDKSIGHECCVPVIL